MKIDGKEYNIDDLVKDINLDMHTSYNGIYLTNRQIDVLKNNGFDYKKYNNIKELMFDLDEYLNSDPDNIELENILSELSEFDYYHNVNK